MITEQENKAECMEIHKKFGVAEFRCPLGGVSLATINSLHADGFLIDRSSTYYKLTPKALELIRS